MYALFHDKVLAAILSESQVDYRGPVSIDPNFELKIPTDASENSTLTAFSSSSSSSNPSFKAFLNSKPPYKHLLSQNQLHTGYHQIDICKPISLGQTSLFYGSSNKGKIKLAYDTAETFIKSQNTQVVIASPNPLKYKKHIPKAIFYKSEISHSEISQYFIPYIALAHACYLRDKGHHVLFILDDLLFHTYKEKTLFHTGKIV